MNTDAYAPVRPKLAWASHVARNRINLDTLHGPTALADFFSNPAAFRNPDAPEPGAVAVAPPWPGARVALVLQPWFQVAEPASILHDCAWQAVEPRRPELLAGPVASLRALAAEMLRDKLALPTLRWGVLAWSSPGRDRMTASDRNLFWWAFQVPVVEQHLGLVGEILADECEAREGWHARPDNCIWEGGSLPGRLLLTSLANLRHPVLRLDSGLVGRISREPCECGRPGPRILDLGAIP
jgi:hypothetical protein